MLYHFGTMPSAYLRHRQPHKSSLRHFLELSFLTGIFVIVSAIAVFTSLGYRLNIQAKTIERSGGVALSIRNGVVAMVQLDGKNEGTTPKRIPHVYPGMHTLLVTADGYQPFKRDITVQAETVTAYNDIFLVFLSPKSVPVNPSWLPLTPTYTDSRLEIKSGNELWQDGKFLTRTSGDIIQSRYSSDSHQIIYQEGKTLWLYTPSSQTTVQLLMAITTAPLLFDMRENGRILVFEQSAGVTQAVALY